MVGHGGKFFNYLTDSATHFIANDSEHPSVSEAIDIFEKPVVTVSVYFVFLLLLLLFFVLIKNRVNGSGFHYVPIKCFQLNHFY